MAWYFTNMPLHLLLMKNYSIYLPLFIILCIAMPGMPLKAQNKPQQDTNYYVTYPSKITGRFYFSKKYTAFNFPASDGSKDFEYRPNTPLTMGLGATYNNLSLNISYGFDFLNDNDEKGKTKSIDLQVHLYPKKWAIDLIALHHEGLYIDPVGYAAADANSYYQRPDAKLMIGGIGAYRVENGEKFSYNAAMIQSAWQKKSAGSLLYGGEAYYGSIQSDSVLVPKQLQNSFTGKNIKRIDFFTGGIGVGYAYTLVIAQHLYITGSLIGNVDVNVTSEEINGAHNKKTSINPSGIYKAAVGYNTENWCISANWAANDLFIRGSSTSNSYSMNTGNYRFIFAKRFNISRKSKSTATTGL